MTTLSNNGVHKSGNYLDGSATSTDCPAREDSYLSKTRIMAAAFLRGHRIMMLWQVRCQLERLTKLSAAELHRILPGSPSVDVRLPVALPVLREEVAILRAFLATEIDQILFGEA